MDIVYKHDICTSSMLCCTLCVSFIKYSSILGQTMTTMPATTTTTNRNSEWANNIRRLWRWRRRRFTYEWTAARIHKYIAFFFGIHNDRECNTSRTLYEHYTRRKMPVYPNWTAWAPSINKENNNKSPHWNGYKFDL